MVEGLEAVAEARAPDADVLGRRAESPADIPWPDLDVLDDYPNFFGNTCGLEGAESNLNSEKAKSNRLKNRYRLPSGDFEEVTFDEKAFAKRLLAPGAAANLAAYRDWLSAREDFAAQNLEKATHDYLAERNLGMGDIVHAVRVAITGTAVGPGLFDCLALIGKELCLRRIDRALAKAARDAAAQPATSGSPPGAAGT